MTVSSKFQSFQRGVRNVRGRSNLRWVGGCVEGRERTDLLPVLALVLRHGAAEDVVLIEGEGGREGQRYAEGAWGGRSKSRL